MEIDWLADPDLIFLVCLDLCQQPPKSVTWSTLDYWFCCELLSGSIQSVDHELTVTEMDWYIWMYLALYKKMFEISLYIVDNNFKSIFILRFLSS